MTRFSAPEILGHVCQNSDKNTRRWPSSLGGRLLGYLSRLSVERFLKPCCVGLRRSLTHCGGVRHLLSENPVRYELVADRQRWLGACYNRAIYTQIASRLWRDTLAIGVIHCERAERNRCTASPARRGKVGRGSVASLRQPFGARKAVGYNR